MEMEIMDEYEEAAKQEHKCLEEDIKEKRWENIKNLESLRDEIGYLRILGKKYEQAYGVLQSLDDTLSQTIKKERELWPESELKI